MDAVTAGLVMCGGLLLYKGARMATAKKAPAKKSSKKSEAPAAAPGGIVTEFGTFTVDSAGVIHQIAYPKSVDAIADMTAEQVEALIRSQA
jgi:hypothetical protein